MKLFALVYKAGGQFYCRVEDKAPKLNGADIEEVFRVKAKGGDCGVFKKLRDKIFKKAEKNGIKDKVFLKMLAN